MKSTKYKIDDVCDISSSKRIYAKEYTESGIPFFRGKEIVEKSNGILKPEADLYISKSRYKELSSKFGSPVKGDLLLTSIGTLGVPYVVPDEEEFYFKDGNLTWFKNFDGLNSYYLYYWLLSPEGRQELKKSTIGTSQSAYTIQLLKKMEIELPEESAQQTIAGTLKKYDDLITNNLKRIAILEDMARNFFLHSINKDDSLETVKLGKLVSNYDRMRKPISSMDRKKMQGEYPYYGAAKEIDSVNDYIFDGQYLLLAEDGSVADKNGYPILQLVNGKFWANNHTHILQGKKVTTEYLYLALSETNIKGFITGSAQPKINQSNMNKIPVPVASEKVRDKLQENIKPIFELVNNLNSRNTALVKTRDLLLPRLMSGAIEV